MRKSFSLLLSITLLFTVGCSSEVSRESSSGEQVSAIRDAKMITLDPVGVIDGPRVVAVGNGSAEILVALGLRSLIVGRDIASEIRELDDVPIVTNGHDLSAEKVLLSNAELLFIDPNTSPRSAISQIEKSGVRVIEIPESFEIDGIYRKIGTIANEVGQGERGDELTQMIATSIDNAVRESDQPSRVLFLYLRGSNGIFLVGGKGSGADSLIEAAGGLDIGSSMYKNPFTPINSEAILGLKPDLYLVMSKGLDSVGGLEAFRNLPGIDEKTPVITVDDSLLLSFGARTADLITQLADAIASSTSTTKS